MKHLALILTLLGCNTTPTDNGANTHGGEHITSVAADEAGTEGTGEPDVDGLDEVTQPVGDEASPAVNAPPQNRRERARAEAEAARDAHCDLVTLSPGLPPAVPAAPSTPALDALRITYQASLAPRFAAPRNRSDAGFRAWTQDVFAVWLRDVRERLLALSREAGGVPMPDMPYARAWLSHANAVFVERMHAAPIPASLAADEVMWTMYTRSIGQQTQPILTQSMEVIQDVDYPATWATWQTEMLLWLAQEGCGFRR